LALEKKLDYYDFLGIAPNDSKSHPLQGVTRFKSMFGGEAIQFDHAFDLPIAKTKYYCYFVYKFRRNFFQKK
jgi:lipid II:glycine glycyltransferase (peptidoglycan interpeptide bridge formation enzyme)